MSWLQFLHLDPDEEDALVRNEHLILVPILVGLCVLIPSVFCSDLRKPKAD